MLLKQLRLTPLFWIVVLGFFLRILNPTYGSPVLYVIGDEPPNYMGAFYAIYQKNLLADTAIYPPVGMWLQIPFLIIFLGIALVFKTHGSISELMGFVATNPGFFYLFHVLFQEF